MSSLLSQPGCPPVSSTQPILPCLSGHSSHSLGPPPCPSCSKAVKDLDLLRSTGVPLPARVDVHRPVMRDWLDLGEGCLHHRRAGKSGIVEDCAASVRSVLSALPCLPAPGIHHTKALLLKYETGLRGIVYTGAPGEAGKAQLNCQVGSWVCRQAPAVRPAAHAGAGPTQTEALPC